MSTPEDLVRKLPNEKGLISPEELALRMDEVRARWTC